MKHWRVLTAIVAATALMGGCQTDDDGDRLLLDALVAQQLDYTVDWQIDLAVPEGGEIIYAELLDDRLVTLEDGNIVTVVNADNGRVLWRHQITRPTTRLSRPQRDDDWLVITSQTRAFVIDIDSGDSEDILDLHRVSLGTPVVTEGLMIHASPQGVLYAQELDGGMMAWNYRIDIGFASSPALAGGRVFATDLTGNVACFDPVTGDRQWERQLGEEAVVPPVANDRLVYVPSVDQSLYALLMSNGRRQWRHYSMSPLDVSPFLVDDVLLQEIPDDAMVSLDPETGDERWRSEELLGARPLQQRGQTMDFFENSELLHVDLRDGQILERTELLNVDHVITSSPRGGELYLMQLNGRILKASPR